MELNDIKKALYKEKPSARFLHIKNGIARYYAHLENGFDIWFNIPCSDMGQTSFLFEMEAHLLIRWIEQ